MRTAGSYQYPAMESVIYGKPAAEALREEAERLDARRVYLIISRTLNTKTDEIEKIRKGLGDRYAASFDGIPQHTTREVVVQTAKHAKDAGADLIVAIGGGSVVDAAKIVLMCMEHEIFDESGLDGFETTPDRRFGPFRNPKVRMIAIPSTLSGGEYNSGSLVTDTRRKLKQIFNHPMMIPRAIMLDPRQRAGRYRLPAGPALSPRRSAPHQGKSQRRGGAHQLPAGLVDVGVRIARKGADGCEPRHRPCAGRHLRRAALFLHGGDDAERAALQPPCDRSGAEADRGCARCAGVRGQRGL